MPSLWSFLQPHDARVRAEVLEQKVPATQAPQPQKSTTVDSEPRNLFSARSGRQFSIFAAGAAFTVFSILITRRALVRKYHAVKPKGTFSPSNQVNEVNGGVEAAEALTLATLNVSSIAIMLTGGAFWAFDISNLEDLRRTMRSRMLHIDGPERTPEQTEDDIEEWMAIAMARMQGKDDKEIADMIKQSAEKGQSRKS